MNNFSQEGTLGLTLSIIMPQKYLKSYMRCKRPHFEKMIHD